MAVVVTVVSIAVAVASTHDGLVRLSGPNRELGDFIRDDVERLTVIDLVYSFVTLLVAAMFLFYSMLRQTDFTRLLLLLLICSFLYFCCASAFAALALLSHP